MSDLIRKFAGLGRLPFDLNLDPPKAMPRQQQPKAPFQNMPMNEEPPMIAPEYEELADLPGPTMLEQLPSAEVAGRPLYSDKEIRQQQIRDQIKHRVLAQQEQRRQMEAARRNQNRSALYLR